MDFHSRPVVCNQPDSKYWHSWFPHLSDANAMAACGFPSNVASTNPDQSRGQLLELNLLARSFQTDYYEPFRGAHAKKVRGIWGNRMPGHVPSLLFAHDSSHPDLVRREV